MKGYCLVDKSGGLDISDFVFMGKIYVYHTVHTEKLVSLCKIFMCQASQFFLCFSNLRKDVDFYRFPNY
jgi:hypothetical protein